MSRPTSQSAASPAAGGLRFTMDVSKDVEDFYYALPVQPELVRIDPDYTVLAKISFNPPGSMLDKMLQSDVIGRLLDGKGIE